jgi:hypothetical protein
MKNIEKLLENYNLLVWSVFPSIETFHDFRSDQRNISFIEKITRLAHQNKLIRKDNEEDFIDLIQRCSEIYKTRKPSAEMNFEALINEIKKDVSVKSLVQDLEGIAGFFNLEKPNEVTFTRLKQDFRPSSLKKQHALLALAMWLSANKPDLGLNYGSIANFPRNATEAQPEPKEGIRMELSFTEPRGNIDPSVMAFLRDALPKCVSHLEMHYLTDTRVTYLATTCIIKIPMKEGFNGVPPTYGEAVRDALSLTYQLMIAWQLTPFYPTTIQFIIAIDAGPFEIISDSIKDLLSPSLPFDLPIRLSHFAYMISKQMDIRVVFKETSHPNVWAIEHFWGFPYFKSPPVLIPSRLADGKESSPLPVRDKDVEIFQDALFFTKAGRFPILDAVRQYPPKIMLALEVAHIATLRRMGHEAVQLLSNVLSFEPYNHIAMTMRMQNFIALGNYAKEWDTACLLYDRALCDGLFVEKYCPPNPVFYAIYGLLFYSKAVKLIRFLRRGDIQGSIPDRRNEVIDYLKKAEFYNTTGMSVSHNAADNRCAFWVGHYYAFRKLLENNPQLFTDKSLPFADADGIYIKEIQYVYKSMGMLTPNLDRKTSEQMKDLRLMLMLGNYLNSISAQSHYTNVLFSATTMLWDFATPESKPLIIDQVLMFLEMAILKATSLKEMCLGVYICTEVQSPGEFIHAINKIKRFLEGIKQTGNYENPVKISLMNLDEDTNAAPITFDLIQAEEKDEGRT